MASTDSYQELSREEAIQIVDGGIRHAAHVMLYAKVDKKLFDRYDIKYAILVSTHTHTHAHTHTHTHTCTHMYTTCMYTTRMYTHSHTPVH